MCCLQATGICLPGVCPALTWMCAAQQYKHSLLISMHVLAVHTACVWPGGEYIQTNSQHVLGAAIQADHVQHLHITTSAAPPPAAVHGGVAAALVALSPPGATALLGGVVVHTAHCCAYTHVPWCPPKIRA